MTDQPLLFTPIEIRELRLKNRVVVSPMATYSARDGFATDWHVTHVGKLAAGGAGLVFVEQSSVSVQGRITHGCLGIWDDAQTAGHTKLVTLIHDLNAKAAIQIAHGGRKASSQRPWEGGEPLGDADVAARGEGPWDIAASSSIPFDAGWPAPHRPAGEPRVSDRRRARAEPRIPGPRTRPRWGRRRRSGAGPPWVGWRSRSGLQGPQRAGEASASFHSPFIRPVYSPRPTHWP
jgi:hypothetical protein